MKNIQRTDALHMGKSSRDRAKQSVAPPPPAAPLLNATFGLAVFSSAFLLFMVQPLVCKTLLPYYGGAPAVWTACMLTFQLLLFAGYAYADLAARLFSPPMQALVHVALLIAAMFFSVLPTAPSDPLGSDMAGQIVLALLTSVGLPFFVLSTSAPLLQAWFARTAAGRSPYFLYVLSNTGSLVSLLSYPFLVEPWFTVDRQVLWWRSAFGAFAFLLGGLAVRTLRSKRPAVVASADELPHVAGSEPISATTYALWFALAFVPSVLLLATTNQVCLDVASVPFMWILPLSLYLLSFVVGFNQAPWNSCRLFAPLCAMATGLIAFMLNWSAFAPILSQAGAFFLALFVCCMFCHGELARMRPPPEHLTSFYLTMSGAGAAGGVFVSLLAPRVFDSYLELHLAVLASLALAIFVCYRNREWPFVERPQRPRAAVVGKIAAVGLSLGVVAGLVYSEWNENSNVLYKTRSFFGVLRVVRHPAEYSGDDMLSLAHGRISHGKQFVAPDKQRIPTTYFTRQSGIGIALRFHHSDRPRRVGVIGLGAGTLAAYGRPGDNFTFFEIDADVDRIAREHFTFLKDCEANWNIVLGDGRLSLEAEQRRGELPFDVLVLDAFSGDAIPTHLITQEAVGLYLERLTKDGVLACHVSNRHLDLRPVLAASARKYQLASRVVMTKAIRDMAPSVWILLSRDASLFNGEGYFGAKPLDSSPEINWTDNYCSLASILNWQTLRRSQSDQWSEGSALVDRAVELIEANDLVGAESVLLAAVKLDSQDAGAWLHLGNVLRRQSRPGEAIEAYRQAIVASPNYAEAHNNFGMLLLKVDRQRGRQHVVQALRLDPRNVDAHNNLGLILAEEADLHGALHEFKQALAIDPDSEAAQKNGSVIQSMIESSKTSTSH